jgi:hypothetical protein
LNKKMLTVATLACVVAFTAMINLAGASELVVFPPGEGRAITATQHHIITRLNLGMVTMVTGPLRVTDTRPRQSQPPSQLKKPKQKNQLHRSSLKYS